MKIIVRILIEERCYFVFSCPFFIIICDVTLLIHAYINLISKGKKIQIKINGELTMPRQWKKTEEYKITFLFIK